MRKTIEERVFTLEEQMRDLRELPTQVAELRSEFSQLRAEMRDEFSAIRGEIAMKADAGFVHGEFGALRAEVIAGDEETRRQMRVLHEDLVGRIALIQEGLPRRGGRRRGPR